MLLQLHWKLFIELNTSLFDTLPIFKSIQRINEFVKRE